MINKVLLIGRLGKDPEARCLDGGAWVARFSIATSESYRDKNDKWVEQTEWHQIVAWRDLAKRMHDQLRKGMLIYLEGKLTSRSWKDSDGKEQRITEVLATSYRVLANKTEQNYVAANMLANDNIPFD